MHHLIEVLITGVAARHSARAPRATDAEAVHAARGTHHVTALVQRVTAALGVTVVIHQRQHGYRRAVSVVIVVTRQGNARVLVVVVGDAAVVVRLAVVVIGQVTTARRAPAAITTVELHAMKSRVPSFALH